MRSLVNFWSRTVFVLCTFVVVWSPATAADQSDEYYELMKAFVDTFEQIERNYVKEVDRRELLEAAIQGMIKELDQYSSYISPDDFARFNQQVEQEFGGIGIQVSGPQAVERLTVISPLPGTPAFKAGLRAGDVIMEIEGKSTEGQTADEAAKVLKGRPGEPVTIRIKHLGSDELEEVTIVRDIIQIPTVTGDTYNEDGSWNYFLDAETKIGYLRLTHFSRRSADELRFALDKLQSQNMGGLILDLRFNPGGLLSQATEIADLFVEKGVIVSTKGRNSRERVWNAKRAGTFSGFPMAVLVNRFSASASEIVGACLQDHKRAVIVGDRTWGKGSVQNVIELEGGDSALKLTTASYHRPSGKNIHKFPDSKESDDWGVLPDEGYLESLTMREMREWQNYRRERDVLKPGEPTKSEFQDRQLDKALEYLRAQLKKQDADANDAKDDTKDEKRDVPTEVKSTDKEEDAESARQWKQELKLRHTLAAA